MAMKQVILRWSAVAALSLSLAALGCSKADESSVETSAETTAPGAKGGEKGDVAKADPATATEGGDGSQPTRHEKMVENAKKAIPTVASDDQTNAATVGTKLPKTIEKDAKAGKDQLAKEAQAVPAAKSTVASTDTYSVVVDAPSGKAGADGKFKIIVKPKTGWKLNMDFPTKLKVEPPAGVTVAKSTLKKKDAAVFSEKKGATWSVGYKSASAGTKKFSGKLKFAVCTDATCDPKVATLAFDVDVK